MNKKILVLACAAVFSAPVFSQTVSDLQTQINQTNTDLSALNITLLNTQAAATTAFNNSGVAESKAFAAQATADNALSTANASTSSINTINIKLTGLQSSLSMALNNAGSAQSTATSAQSTANSALASASTTATGLATTNANLATTNSNLAKTNTNVTSLTTTVNGLTTGLATTNANAATNTASINSLNSGLATTNANLATTNSTLDLTTQIARQALNTANTTSQGLMTTNSNFSTLTADVSSIHASLNTGSVNTNTLNASGNAAIAGNIGVGGNMGVAGNFAVAGKIVGQNNVLSVGTNAIQIVSGSSTASSGVNDRITTDGQAPGGADLHLGGTTITSSGIVGTTPVNVQVDGVLITNNGINASGTKITGVANGTISATSSDAVNGSQLNAVSTGVNAKIGTLTGGVGQVPMVGEQPDATSYAHAVAQSAWIQSMNYTDGRANYLQGQINQNTADIATLKTGFANQQNQINQLNGGVAMAGAMAQLRINPTAGDGVYGAAGIATFNGSNALSAGLVGVIGDISISGSVALTSGSSSSSMFGVGISKKLF